MWVDVRLLYMLVREGLTETVTFDQSPEKKNGRTSHILCGGMLLQREDQVQSPEVTPLWAFLRDSKEDRVAEVT